MDTQYYTTEHRKGQHLLAEERHEIEVRLKDGWSPYRIAKHLGRAYNTIKNEIARGTVYMYNGKVSRYKAKAGEEQYKENRRNSCRQYKRGLFSGYYNTQGITEGSIGQDISWRFEDNTIYISGTGEIPYYGYEHLSPTFEPAPWSHLRNDKIVISEGITSIGEGSLSMSGCSSISIPGSLEEWDGDEWDFYFNGIFYFTGSVPKWIDHLQYLDDVTTAYYPLNDPSWTETVRWNYGPHITWIAYDPLAHEHQYSAVVTEPTCTEGGFTTYTCSVCGEVVQDDFTEATGHNYEAVVTSPSCTEGGYTTYTCSYCGVGYHADQVPALGHTWDEGLVTTLPTAQAEGVMTFTCTRCDETKTEAVPKLESKVFEITKQPEIYVGPIGSNATFHVEAVGEDLTYQWYYSPDAVGWSPSGLTGNKTDTLQVAFTASRAGQFYRCEIRNAKGEVLTSDAVFMCEALPPITIQQQPESFMGQAGETGVFHVSATGNGLTYQWYYSKDNGVTWSKSGQTGSTTDTMKIQLTSARAGQCYRCEITDADGNILNSEQAAIKLETENIEIKYQPVSANGYIGETTTFHVEATGMGLTYQWYYSKDGGRTWAPSGMAGCDTDTLKVQLTAARVGQSYRCAVTDSKGNTVYSDVVAMNQKISVVGVLEINAQPKDFTGKVGDTAVFYVDAVGEALTFQWEYSKDGKQWDPSGLPGSKTDTLRVEVTASRIGQHYRCVITDAKGKQIISDPVTLHQA